MAKTLLQYADWLSERDMRWPAAPPVIPVQATPSVKPLAQIRAVTWNLYGTLLRITDGDLLFQHPQAIRMEIALDKTIQEFNMWNSMTRRPGKPFEYLLPKYINSIKDAGLRSGNQKGDFPEVDAARIWYGLLELLSRKEYQYDASFYGDPVEYAQKVAYFFHSALQGIEAAPSAHLTLTAIANAGISQALFANGQCFSIVQLVRSLRQQGTILDINDIFQSSLNTLSYEWGIRKPSVSLYGQMLFQLKNQGISAHEVLHVGTRIADDLAIAKSCGIRTALYAGDKTSLQASHSDLMNAETRPDRLITDLAQLRDILQV